LWIMLRFHIIPAISNQELTDVLVPKKEFWVNSINNQLNATI